MACGYLRYFLAMHNDASLDSVVKYYQKFLKNYSFERFFRYPDYLFVSNAIGLCQEIESILIHLSEFAAALRVIRWFTLWT